VKCIFNLFKHFIQTNTMRQITVIMSECRYTLYSLLAVSLSHTHTHTHTHTRSLRLKWTLVRSLTVLYCLPLFCDN